jgi:hypothetical protein
MNDTWNDLADYEQSRADCEILREQMEANWTWPAPTPDTAADVDQLDAAHLDPTGRFYPVDDRTELERAAARLAEAETELTRARQDWYNELPMPTRLLRCSKCSGLDDWQVVEEGYERASSAERTIADDVPTTTQSRIRLDVSAGGWSDFSDEGQFTYLLCSKNVGPGYKECGTAHQLPVNMEWV